MLAAPLITKARTEVGDPPAVKSYLGDRIQPGKPVPKFSVPSLDDPAIVLTEASLRGKVYLIDFWATWCAPCMAEIDDKNLMLEQYRDKGLEVVNICIHSTADKWKTLLSKRRIDGVNLFADEKLWDRIDVAFKTNHAIPHHLLIAPDGTVYENGTLTPAEMPVILKPLLK